MKSQIIESLLVFFHFPLRFFFVSDCPLSRLKLQFVLEPFPLIFYKLDQRPVVHLLTELGADLTLKDKNDETVLHKIAKNINFTSESSWLSAFKILMSKLSPETMNFKVKLKNVSNIDHEILE